MTDKQKFKFYFPAWNDCCQANGWRTVKGFSTIADERLTEEGRKVLVFARQRAAMRDGAVLTIAQPVKLDDLRHGAHWFALGRDKSSGKLTNAEVDRVVTLFRLLQDPEDLDARMKWDAYQRGEDPGEVKRLDYAIKNAAPDAYVRKIAGDLFGSRQWEWLDVPQKRRLAMTLSERNRSWRKPMEPAARALRERRPPGKSYQLDPQLKFTKGPF